MKKTKKYQGIKRHLKAKRKNAKFNKLKKLLFGVKIPNNPYSKQELKALNK